MNTNLQIISGQFRGKKLCLPPDARPTQNKARIALFNMLADFRPAVVWDAFAGSGAFGLEFLSRFPDCKVIFSDTDIKTVNKNKFGAPTIVAADAISLIDRFGALADIVFIDPPYSAPELGRRFASAFSKVAKPGAILVWEFETTYEPMTPAGFVVLKDKTYGRARFFILKKT